MIMIHVRYNYTCVIIGWDTQCERSPQWMDEMGSQELSGGATQPFYNVLTNDGSWQYNAQGKYTIWKRAIKSYLISHKLIIFTFVFRKLDDGIGTMFHYSRRSWQIF